MLLGELVKIIESRLQNFNLGNDADLIRSYVNLGMSEIYNRFNLKLGSETIHTNPDQAMYTLRSNDVNLLLAIYRPDGVELKQSDVTDGRDFDYKQVNYNTFILRKAFDGILYAIYKASPITLEDNEDEVLLPAPLLEPLITYVTYRILSILYRDQGSEAMSYYQVYKAMVGELDAQGYTIPIDTERLAVQAKGFV